MRTLLQLLLLKIETRHDVIYEYFRSFDSPFADRGGFVPRVSDVEESVAVPVLKNPICKKIVITIK